MRQVVAAMPCVKLQSFSEGDVALIFGVVIIACPIVGSQTQPKLVPAVVQTMKDVQGGSYVEISGIGGRRPGAFIIRLDNGIELSQRQFAANKAIHVTVR